MSLLLPSCVIAPRPAGIAQRPLNENEAMSIQPQFQVMRALLASTGSLDNCAMLNSGCVV